MGGMGLSVGFEPLSNARSKARDTVTRVKAVLHELSLTHIPAYATAGVSAIREEETMPETTEVETAPVVSALDTSPFARADDVAALQRQIADPSTIHTTAAARRPRASSSATTVSTASRSAPSTT